MQSFVGYVVILVNKRIKKKELIREYMIIA